MNKRLKILIAIALISITVAVGYKVYADYIYTSGLRGNIVTFMSPKDYNFNFGTVYNDEYTKAGEPNGNGFDITDNTLLWYLPSGTWGLQSTFVNETYWKQYFVSLVVTATFTDAHGTVGTMILGYTETGDYQNPCPMFVASGVDNGTISVRIQGTVNPNLVAGEVNIPCTTLIEWCPAS